MGSGLQDVLYSPMVRADACVGVNRSKEVDLVVSDSAFGVIVDLGFLPRLFIRFSRLALCSASVWPYTAMSTTWRSIKHLQKLGEFLLCGYCKDNYLILNATNNKELVIDVRKSKPEPSNIVIEHKCVKGVNTYKYLGVLFDDKLDWSAHMDYVMKKLNSRVYCFRKMNAFRVSNEILVTFYLIVLSVGYELLCDGLGWERFKKG